MSSNEVKFCLIIPCYEKHADLMEATLKNYADLKIDIIIIDDGSSNFYALKIKELAAKYKASLCINEKNLGKGGAVKTGLLYAWEMGYSHALQVDSDGQHDHQSIVKLIENSKKYPHDLISGRPIYDEAVPKSRFYGRYLTHVWVWIETLSFSLKDSMCGFRSYPLSSTVKIIKNYEVGDKMDFDIEIMVRLYWSGVLVRFIPVKVQYPVDTISYFDGMRDNILISKMHTKLFFGMLKRMPLLVARKTTNTKLWHESSERGALVFMRFTIWVFFVFGDTVVRQLVKLISLYYAVFSKESKCNAKVFYSKYSRICHAKKVKAQNINFFKHVLSFANMIVDKVAVWKGRITRENLNQGDVENYYKILKQYKGALFLSSHYGNIEVARAIGKLNSNIKFNALMYTNNSQKITGLLNEINPQMKMNVIGVKNVGPELGSVLKEKIDQGEYIFCMGDRTTLNSEKKISVELLGSKINLPAGPFLMSYLLKCPTFCFHCYREGRKFRIKVQKIQPAINPDKKNRELFIQKLSEAYISEVESLILNDPSQWFNFNAIWKEENGN